MNQNTKEKIQTELLWLYSKSSGPGGQHVNTTDSKAQLKWNILTSSALSNNQKRLIQTKLKNYIRKNSHFYLSCSKHRSKESNKKECLKKLFNLLENKAFKLEKKRFKTKPTKSSIEKRLKDKKTKSEIKKGRQKVKV